MLAVEAEHAGGPEVLRVVDRPDPAPGPGQIRVRHKAIGLNYIDTYHRSGLYPMPMPLVLGLEGAGVVDAVGDGVTRFHVGDRAAYGSGPIGAYAETHIVPADKAVHLPDAISFEVAAASLLKGMTVEYLIKRLYPVQTGETILLHAAAGGVGQILIQWAKSLGAVVIATAGGTEKVALARRLGADYALDNRSEDIAAAVKEITGGKGVRVVYDSVGPATFEASLKSLGRRGMFVSFGNASGLVEPVPPSLLQKHGSLFLTRPTLMDYTATVEELDACATAFFDVVTDETVKIDIAQTFALKDARAAHEALESRKTVGSTILIP